MSERLRISTGSYGLTPPEKNVISFEEIEKEIKKAEGGFDYFAGELVGALIQIVEVQFIEENGYKIALVKARILDAGETGINENGLVIIRFSGRTAVKQLEKVAEYIIRRNCRVNAYITLRTSKNGRNYIALSSRR